MNGTVITILELNQLGTTCSSLHYDSCFKMSNVLTVNVTGQFYASCNTQQKKPVGFMSDPHFKLWAFCF